MRFKDKTFLYYGGSMKNAIFRGGGSQRNQYTRGDCLKSGAWAVSRFKSGLAEKRGFDTAMHTMICMQTTTAKK